MNCSTFIFLGVIVLAIGLASAVGQSRSPSDSGGTSIPSPTLPRDVSRVTIVLSGNVITEDGSPLPAQVFIEHVCDGHVSREGSTDIKGYFTVTIHRNAQAWSNAAQGSAESGGGSLSTYSMPAVQSLQNSGRLTGDLASCELRGSLGGFRSSTVRIPLEPGTAITPMNVGTIILQRTEQAQGVTVSATGLNAPKNARKEYQKGHRAAENNKLPDAQQELERAVQLYPRYAADWQDLGWVYARQNQLDKARDSFAQARAADGKFVPAYVGLSSIAVRESRGKLSYPRHARNVIPDATGPLCRSNNTT